MYWNFGIKDLAMQTSNKWQKCPNLKPLWGFQNWKGGEDYLWRLSNGKTNKGESSKGECDLYIMLLRASPC